VPELDPIVAALSPALQEIRFIGGKDPVPRSWPWPRPGWWPIHPDISVHRAPAYAHSACDVGNVCTLLMQGADSLVGGDALGMACLARFLRALQPVLRTLPLPLIHGVAWQLFLLGWGPLGREDSSRFLEHGTLAEKEGLQRLDKVLGEVEAIRHLDSIWCSSPRRFGITTTSIPADDLGAAVLLQPGNHRVRFAIGEQVDNMVTL
jgi:hypothetical protein